MNKSSLLWLASTIRNNAGDSVAVVVGSLICLALLGIAGSMGFIPFMVTVAITAISATAVMAAVTL